MNSLNGEDDPIKIYRYQGELECLRILRMMPEENERLDSLLNKIQDSENMKHSSQQRETVNG